MNRRIFLGTCASIASAVTLSACGMALSKSVSAPDAARFAALRRFAETPYGRIAYVEKGRGATALFLHGLPLNGFHWRGSLELLRLHRRCIAPDFMGLGYTQAPEKQDLSPQAQADMLVAFLDALAISCVDLVANDSGGTIAQLLATQHPERVRTMLLTNCDVHENCPPAQMRNSINAAKAGTYDQKMQRHLDDRAYARSDKGIVGSTYMDPMKVTDETLEYYFSPLVASPLRKSQLNRYLVALDPNPLLAVEAALRRLSTPTRMLWGTADPLFPASWAIWLDKTLPGSRGIRLVEGGKLFWPEEMPEVVAEEARALWGV
ncbi:MULTISPECIES: alpha/beta hydrolase [unclassified Lysobacter]|uniref:alpha/beta fold hydrolase n=1 Tax=unclassified Lysobacter TaxID=2635362 RepID=UPI001BEC22C6|nr:MULTISPECIES: alpha/beta hydrolase [unclassified Lysobacter]MBT2748753.1 alpha/beta hydrolase [Lysobacter sp. ISL-42]MBT2751688.1 alpha/beta hydrolase [Lysobacter sp. ISL-50]MBT2775882.1 alpha/beta hydrolase [Lysobacter sp. ISL-54]MBT2782154.1 alpha/beta hydrolase [Lysobacter sp. ISL-52]